MRFIVTLLCVISMSGVDAEPLRVAVASNFTPTAKTLSARFEAEHGIDVDLISGSTGKLYAQIANGAPFDVFLAADVRRPERLEMYGFTIPGSRFTYARGRLMLWARDVDGDGEDCIDALLATERPRIAIANPRTAPYGFAAQEYLVQAGLWDSVRPRLVTGENVAQALAFVSAGGADFGFIAASQSAVLPEDACLWPIPQTLYTPIRQQAVALENSGDAAIVFLDFLRGDARALIEADGYSVTGDD